MTAHQYSEDEGDHILATEKMEILARLRRAKAEFRRQGGKVY